MAVPDRDTVYTNDGTNRAVYTRESNSTGWFIGIIVALALLAIAYLVFSANSQPSSTSTTVNNTPAITTPMAPADNGTSVAPMTSTAPITSTAPTAPASTSVAPSAPATDLSSAPAATSSAAPATSSAQ